MSGTSLLGVPAAAWLKSAGILSRRYIDGRRNLGVFAIRSIVKFYIILVAICLSGAASATPKPSPFGIPQGTPIKSLKIIRMSSASRYVVVPPIKNSNFEKYTVIATPKSGVCAILASSREYDNANDAEQEFDDIVRLLNVYGKSHNVKFGSEWPILEMNSRYLPVEWNTALPNGLDSIVAEPIKRGAAFTVEVSYVYRNIRRCLNWQPNQDRRGL
jgi:hypothetical protein